MADSRPPAAPGHRQRLRERFLRLGLDSFDDDQVLELLLTLATPRQDCKQRARDLLCRFGCLSAVLDAGPAELAAVEGIGPKNVLGLKLIPAVARRYFRDLALRPGDWKPAGAALGLMGEWAGLRRELFRVYFLDSHQQPLGYEDLFAGTLDQAAVYPREVVARALARGAAAVVCAHNHPGGDPTPSPDDQAATRRIHHACRGVEVQLWDHLIIGAESWRSFREDGEINRLDREWASLGL